MQKLDKKVAVITGAAQGIGLAIAETFAREGAHLVLLDLQTDSLKFVADMLAMQHNIEVITEMIDVTDEKAVTSVIQRAAEHFGHVDILINNAGINVFSDPLKLSKQDWARCFAVDLEGVWHCTKAALPYMLDNSYGHIVNIASVHGHKIVPGSFPYPVAKHGLIGMTRALGIEYADKGIRVNSISPGLIATPLAERYFESFEDPKAARDEERAALPCKRFGTPEEVANTALFLASDEAKFINATDILIDGGRCQVY